MLVEWTQHRTRYPIMHGFESCRGNFSARHFIGQEIHSQSQTISESIFKVPNIYYNNVLRSNIRVDMARLSREIKRQSTKGREH